MNELHKDATKPGERDSGSRYPIGGYFGALGCDHPRRAQDVRRQPTCVGEFDREGRSIHGVPLSLRGRRQSASSKLACWFNRLLNCVVPIAILGSIWICVQNPQIGQHVNKPLSQWSFTELFLAETAGLGMGRFDYQYDPFIASMVGGIFLVIALFVWKEVRR